jgi:hypothetical protein
MRTKNTLTVAIMIALSVLVLANVSAELSVGVKKGDWIEYNVSFTGDASLGHDVTWARLEVTNVQGAIVTVNITTKSTSGTISNLSPTILNLDTGELVDDFIIPANLQSGESFFDRNQGNITITGVEERTVAGAERTLLTGATPDTTYHWDQPTGVLVEANSTYTDYSITTKVDQTNMWQPPIFGLDPSVFYVVLAGIVILVVALIVLIVVKRRRSN